MAEDPAWVEVYLHPDTLEWLCESSYFDRRTWERHLGRTPRLTEAWAKLGMANKQWNTRRQHQAKAAWNGIAIEYSDTDAAYASLANLAKVLQAQGQIPGAIEASAAASLNVCADFTSYQICEVGPNTRSFSGKVRFQDEA